MNGGRKWNPERYAARKALSTVVNRPVRLVRAPAGTQQWKEGLLRLVDAETDEILAVVHPLGFKDPATSWDLRIDC